MKSATFTLLLTFAIGAGAQSLETFFGKPTASNLAVSENGDLAWVVNDHGKRNIMVRSGGVVKQLTNYALDDGQEIGSLIFTHDGQSLLFVRGAGANRAGQHPNPASLADAPDQAIWCANVSDQSIFKVAVGNNPALIPGTNSLVFTKGGQIQEVAIQRDASSKNLFQARGNNSPSDFSHDGSRLSFVSDRGDHSFIGVFNLRERTISWIAPALGNDQFPAWSPDDRQIAFIRQPGDRAEELRNITGGVTFEILVADANTGKARTIWSSPADDGGFAQYYPSTPLSWSKSDRILFFSEHEGWNHVYSLNPDGSDLRDITPGDGIVESYCYNQDESGIYFDGNRSDIDRRHVWFSKVKEGAPVSVTAGTGIEMYPKWGKGGLYCFQSTYDRPLVLASVDEKKKTLSPVASSPGGSADKSFVVPEQVIFKAADGTTIHGQLFINRSIKGKRPGVVFMHGGPIRQMLLGFHYSEYYINTYAFNQYLASKGYAVLSVNYRDGIGYGRDFRRAKNQGPRGASEYQDVVAAGQYLQSLPEVDGGKIGLWGGSYGGYLTAMGLARNPELFKAGVDLHGVHDWAFRARAFSPGGGWAIKQEDMDLAFQSSPVSDLSKWTGPVLLVHGDDDRNVLFQQSIDLAERLRDRNVPVEVLVLPDEVHGFLRYQSWKTVFEAAADFFDRKLR